MILLGQHNVLKATRRTDNGMYLTDDVQSAEVLLPNRYVPHEMVVGNKIKVFIFKDSEDRLTATTSTPLIELHQFACLQVREVNNVGAFLDWGLEKDLFVPFKEQPGRMLKGHWYMVFLYLDSETDRLVASGRYLRFLHNENLGLRVGEEVDLIIDNQTKLGYNVIINHLYKGLIYQNELYKTVLRGEKMRGYIKNIRDDNKIDVTLRKPGVVLIEPNSGKILEVLRNNNGYLSLTDKSESSAILARLGMSKKTFKKAVGNLYKLRKIRLEEDGIYLND
jgi:hypothetical protein